MFSAPAQCRPPARLYFINEKVCVITQSAESDVSVGCPILQKHLPSSSLPTCTTVPRFCIVCCSRLGLLRLQQAAHAFLASQLAWNGSSLPEALQIYAQQSFAEPPPEAFNRVQVRRPWGQLHQFHLLRLVKWPGCHAPQEGLVVTKDMMQPWRLRLLWLMRHGRSKSHMAGKIVSYRMMLKNTSQAPDS